MTSGETLRLRQPLPGSRSYAQILHHYQVEKALADQLKATDRAGRVRIYQTMYDILFREVPDHPRLSRRHDEHASEHANRGKLALLRPVLAPDHIVLEFGSGDCAFMAMLSAQVRQTVAVDISDQRDRERCFPDNLRHVVYDGFDLDCIQPGSVDVAFSDQLIEHLHPEETAAHLRLVARLLKPGGCYVLNTPHPMNGPHDVSKYFSDVAQGFHLKEWTFTELAALLRDSGFSRIHARWTARRINFPLPMGLVRLMEAGLARLPSAWARCLSRYALPTVAIVAWKEAGPQ